MDSTTNSSVFPAIGTGTDEGELLQRNSVAKRARTSVEGGEDFLHLPPPSKSKLSRTELDTSRPNNKSTEVAHSSFTTRLVHVCDDVVSELFAYYLFDIRSLLCLWLTGNKSMQCCMRRLVTCVVDGEVHSSRCINHFSFIWEYLPNTRRMHFRVRKMQNIPIIFPSKLSHLTIQVTLSNTNFHMNSITHPETLEYLKIRCAAVQFEQNNSDRMAIECAAKFSSLHTLICGDIFGDVPPSVTHLEVDEDFLLSRCLPPNLKTLIVDMYKCLDHNFEAFQLPATITELDLSPYNTVEDLVTYCPTTLTEIKHIVNILSPSDIDRLAIHLPNLSSVFLVTFNGVVHSSDGASCHLLDLRNLTSLRKLHLWISPGMDLHLPPMLRTLLINNSFLVDNLWIVENRLSLFRKTRNIDLWTSQFELN